MSNPVIKVESLSKKFLISHEAPERYTTLRDTITRGARKFLPGGRTDSSQKSSKEEFWALKDINFEIQSGDRVGIIGRNGAGKSTLLKVLSRITEPTQGRISIRGRVASLLEVGTGFHPELSGRENVFLNGAILGMSRTEIRKKFDEIVAFAEVERFLDTPVKRYSSGMYVRLAFAVAAHLEPEVLVVDEVLAVGDAQFQRKCLGKMEEVSNKDGRTVLFVSHNMGAIKALCTSAIILHKGEKILQGDVYESLAKYLSFEQTEINNQTRYSREKPPLGKKMYLSAIELVDDQSNDYFSLIAKLKIHSAITSRIGINLRIKDGMGFPVALGCVHYSHSEELLINEGENELTVTSRPLYLAIGIYKFTAELVIPGAELIDGLEDCIQFELSNDTMAKRKYGVVQNWGLGSTEIIIDNVKRDK